MELLLLLTLGSLFQSKMSFIVLRRNTCRASVLADTKYSKTLLDSGKRNKKRSTITIQCAMKTSESGRNFLPVSYTRFSCCLFPDPWNSQVLNLTAAYSPRCYSLEWMWKWRILWVSLKDMDLHGFILQWNRLVYGEMEYIGFWKLTARHHRNVWLWCCL